MRISLASGADLDYWVAMALGLQPSIHPFVGERTCFARKSAYDRAIPFRPSSCWKDGGPIVDSEHIDFKWTSWGTHWQCIAIKPGKFGAPSCEAAGESALIAAMRVCVVAKFGDVSLVSVASDIASRGEVSQDAVLRHPIGRTAA